MQPSAYRRKWTEVAPYTPLARTWMMSIARTFNNVFSKARSVPTCFCLCESVALHFSHNPLFFSGSARGDALPVGFSQHQTDASHRSSSVLSLPETHEQRVGACESRWISHRPVHMCHSEVCGLECGFSATLLGAKRCEKNVQSRHEAVMWSRHVVAKLAKRVLQKYVHTCGYAKWRKHVGIQFKNMSAP